MFQSVYEETELLDMACNAVLVNYDIRPAFLFQNAGYSKDNMGLKTKKILDSLAKYFKIIPTYAGFIITKQPIDVLNNELNDKIIGEIIGYPCAGDLHCEKTRKYSYHIIVDLKSVEVGKEITLGEKELMAVVCGKNMDMWFAEKVESIKKLFDSLKLPFDVKYQRNKLYSTEKIVQKIIKFEKINSDEEFHILNELWNYEFCLIFHYHKKNQINIFEHPELLITIMCGLATNNSTQETLLYQKKILRTKFGINIDNQTIEQIYKKSYFGNEIKLQKESRRH
jgi:hypothetical protein